MRLDQRRSLAHLSGRHEALPAVLCAIGVLCSLPAAAAYQAAAPATSTVTPAITHVAHSQRQELYFERRYGMGQLRVHSISAGASLEFRCQVLDAEKAKALNDNRVAPVMTERKSGTKLSVATDENIGKPHQVAAPEAGREFRTVFGNRGKIVKPGNMVDLVIGSVHMSGLIVE
jgi:hypothetical protein